MIRQRELYDALKQEELAQAEAAVSQGREHVQQQAAIVAGLKQGGHNSAVAELLLETFIQSQTLHEEHLNALRCELGLSGFEVTGQPPAARAAAR